MYLPGHKGNIIGDLYVKQHNDVSDYWDLDTLSLDFRKGRGVDELVCGGCGEDLRVI